MHASLRMVRASFLVSEVARSNEAMAAGSVVTRQQGVGAEGGGSARGTRAQSASGTVRAMSIGTFSLSHD